MQTYDPHQANLIGHDDEDIDESILDDETPEEQSILDEARLGDLRDEAGEAAIAELIGEIAESGDGEDDDFDLQAGGMFPPREWPGAAAEVAPEGEGVVSVEVTDDDLLYSAAIMAVSKGKGFDGPALAEILGASVNTRSDIKLQLVIEVLSLGKRLTGELFMGCLEKLGLSTVVEEAREVAAELARSKAVEVEEVTAGADESSSAQTERSGYRGGRTVPVAEGELIGAGLDVVSSYPFVMPQSAEAAAAVVEEASSSGETADASGPSAVLAAESTLATPAKNGES